MARRSGRGGSRRPLVSRVSLTKVFLKEMNLVSRVEQIQSAHYPRMRTQSSTSIALVLAACICSAVAGSRTAVHGYSATGRKIGDGLTGGADHFEARSSTGFGTLAVNRLRGGEVQPAAAPVSVGNDAPLRAPRREKKKKTTSEAPMDDPKAPPAQEVRRPHELTIEAGNADQDGSTALMHPNKLSELGIMDGDILRLKGRRDRETLCIVQESTKV
jgi:hypothetical protein